MKKALISQACKAVLLAAAVLAFCSCKREPLHEPFSNYYLQLEPDFDALHIKPVDPGMYEVVFYDKITHNEVGQSYLGSNGGYIYGLGPGTYEMIVYGFDSGNTVVSGLGTFTGAVAKTEIYSNGIHNAPDHFIVASDENFEIPFLFDRDEPEILYAYPRTIMDTWCVVVDGIKGLENATEINFFISGQSSSNNFGPDVISKEMMTIHFPGTVNAEGDKIYTPFCTFGRFPGTPSNLKLSIIDSNEQTVECQADITGQFDDPDNTGHWIYLHFDITLSPKTDGGMQPVVEPWNDNVFIYEIY